MKKDSKEKEINTIADVAEADKYGDGVQSVTLTPLQEITELMVRVAEGGSVSELRTRVSQLVPKTNPEARTMFQQLSRLRDAADVVVRTATEMLAQVENG